jgi:hypothetical protein
VTVTTTAEQRVQWRDLVKKSTIGRWFVGYSAVHSWPLFDEYNRLEREIPTDTPDDDARWRALPETVVCSVPRIAGDTPTKQGAHDADFIVAARVAVPALLDDVEQLIHENERLRDKLRVSEEQNEALGAVNVTQVDNDRLKEALVEALALIDHFPIDSERTWPQDRERAKQRVAELRKLVQL